MPFRCSATDLSATIALSYEKSPARRDHTMKKRLLCLLLCAAAIFTSACTFFSGEYRSVKEHEEQSQPSSTAPSEDEGPAVVHNRNELRGEMLRFVRDWREVGTILTQDYLGDLSEDLPDALHYITEEDPIGSFAVDYADAELLESGVISLRIVFRRSAAEIDAIVTVDGIDDAYDMIYGMLENCRTSLTLRIRDYEETDFLQSIRSYSLLHLTTVAAVPQVSAQLYPKSGRTRILELHFVFPESRDTLLLKAESVATILNSARSFVSGGSNDTRRLELIYRFLKNRFQYTPVSEEPATPAYSLLCEGKLHSLSLAAVCRFEGAMSNLSCELIEGTKNGEPYFWNTILITQGGESVTYHVDLMRDLLDDLDTPALRTDAELLAEGYDWPGAPQPTPEPTEES